MGGCIKETQIWSCNPDNILNVLPVEQIHRESRYKLPRAEQFCCLRAVTSVQIIDPFSVGPCPVLFAVAMATRAVVQEAEQGLVQARWDLRGGGFWTGWTAFSSRAFQNLPGAPLKQKEEEEEEVGLPVGM